jgi:UDP-N-acetylglucosamine--N-acetylmuramyl-(pentapeptide) pyrophosphoryl-undecaprenol N-acetylglucosamine transferase
VLKEKWRWKKYPRLGILLLVYQLQDQPLEYAGKLGFPLKLISSLLRARKIVKDFQPDVAVGVGGYASGPLLLSASFANVPILIQEQNSYAGITNKF